MQQKIYKQIIPSPPASPPLPASPAPPFLCIGRYRLHVGRYWSSTHSTRWGSARRYRLNRKRRGRRRPLGGWVGWLVGEPKKAPNHRAQKKTPMLLLVELRTCNRCWTCSFLGDGLVGLDFGKDVWKKFQQKIFSKWLSFNGDLPWKKKKLDPGNHPEGCTPRKHGICFIFSLFPWKKVKKSPYTNPKLVGWESVPLKVERVKLP